MTAPSNVLAADSLAEIIASILPENVSPQLKTPYDALAIAAHSTMVAVGFRLIGLGEDHKIDIDSNTEHSQSLPPEWNASQHYAFRYAHSQSSMEYLLKVNRMGNKAIVLGMAVGDDKPASFDVKVADYVSESNLPATPVATEDGNGVCDIFISTGRLADFGVLMRIQIIQKLLPSLQKEGYEESTTSNTRARAERGNTNAPQSDPLREDYQPPARPHPLHDPLAQPRRPFPAGELPPPGFEDPYDLNRPLRPAGGMPGYGNIGERDLYPQGLGPRDGLWGGVGPGLGGGGGGMHPTFDDPLFAGGRGGAGGAYDPQAPPGSRYDPIGPGGAAPRGNGGGGYPGGNVGSRPPNPFGGFGSGDFI